jgi:hypothetical protein
MAAGRKYRELLEEEAQRKRALIKDVEMKNE